MIGKESISGLCGQKRVLIQSADFVYLLPHINLRKWISNYTITFPSVGLMSDNYAVIPHGSATLVLASDGNRSQVSLFGPITKPAYVGRHANRFKMLFIVEFQPAGYYAFSGMPQKELTDCVIPFCDVNMTLNRLMAEKLESASDINGFISEIDKIFLANLKITFYQQELTLANSLILQNKGRLSVKELSQNVFYSERHLNRIFDEYMGTTVKSFSRLVRVNSAIRLLMKRDYSITQVFMETGFYDMPHFIHDFKSICGVTPQEYRDNMSDFYSEIAKF